MGSCHLPPEQHFNLIWGYAGRLAEQVVELEAVAGTNYLVHTAVPAGQVWVVTGGSVLSVGAATASIMWLLVGATTHAVYSFSPISSGVYSVSDPLHIVLAPGDLIRMSFSACAAGDDLYSNIWGYKMILVQ